MVHWTFPEEGRKDEARWGEALPTFAGFHAETFDPDRDFVRKECITYDRVKRVAALSDIHGQYPVARKLLLANGIIDENENWIFEDGHLVIVGDVFDRGDQVNAMLWLIYHLEQQAALAGGRVHFLLGNHETMVMEGDVRYVNERYLKTSSLLKTTYQNLYGQETHLGKWLRTLPLSVKVNNVVYVHGGFSSDVVKKVGGLKEINDTYHEYLMNHNPNLAAMGSSNLELLHGRNGPLWYRGYFQDRDFSRRDIDRILRKLEADHLVVGHTSFSAIKGFFGNRVFAVDSSIKFGSVGELLLIEDGIFRRGTLTGEVLDIELTK